VGGTRPGASTKSLRKKIQTTASDPPAIQRGDKHQGRIRKKKKLGRKKKVEQKPKRYGPLKNLKPLGRAGAEGVWGEHLEKRDQWGAMKTREGSSFFQNKNCSKERD